jgi:hypothetical protein
MKNVNNMTKLITLAEATNIEFCVAEQVLPHPLDLENTIKIGLKFDKLFEAMKVYLPESCYQSMIKTKLEEAFLLYQKGLHVVPRNPYD